MASLLAYKRVFDLRAGKLFPVDVRSLLELKKVVGVDEVRVWA
jgi:hypothetical protein